MPLLQQQDTLTPAQTEQMRYEAEREDKQMEYGLRMKELEIQLEKTVARWQAWFKIPVLILKLPLLLILGIAYIVHVAKKIEPSENFWNLLK